jgi:hypothetical protein
VHGGLESGWVLIGVLLGKSLIKDNMLDQNVEKVRYVRVEK